MRKRICLFLLMTLFLSLCACNPKMFSKDQQITLSVHEYVATLNAQLADNGVTATFYQADLSDYWYGEYDEEVTLYLCNLSEQDTLYLLVYEKEKHSDNSYASMHLVSYDGELKSVQRTSGINIFVALANYICSDNITNGDVNSLIYDDMMNDSWVYNVGFVGRHGTLGPSQQKYKYVNEEAFSVLQYEICQCYRNEDSEDHVYGQEISLRCNLPYNIKKTGDG